MRLPRVSIGTLMITAALLALNFGLLRTIFVTDWSPNSPTSFIAPSVAIGSLPMLNALAIALVLLVRQMIRRTECGAGILGFSLFGAVALLATAGTLILDGDLVEWYMNSLGWSVERGLAAIELSWLSLGGSALAYAIESFLCMVLIAPWQFAPAFVGAWLNRRLGIVLVRRPARETARRLVQAATEE